MANTPAPEVTRNVHFFRADLGKDANGNAITLSPKAPLHHVGKMLFTPTGRYHDVDDTRYCCWVDESASSPCQVRFAVIRQAGLPYVETKGLQRALQLPATAGLVEQCHVVFFPKNIVGYEFNFYGPRIGRLAAYMNDKAKNYLPGAIGFDPLLRDDAKQRLDKFSELRLVRLRVRRSKTDVIKKANKSLAAAFEAAARASGADELELVLRPRPYSREGLGSNTFAAVKALLRRPDLKDAVSAFEVKGFRPDARCIDEVDLLGDEFIVSRPMQLEQKRSRVIKKKSAYKEIRAAYNDVKAELVKAAAIAAGP